jgi:serine/threonine protein kinase
MHRDIKPENLLIEKENNKDTLKVIDFGISTYFKPN